MNSNHKKKTLYKSKVKTRETATTSAFENNRNIFFLKKNFTLIVLSLIILIAVFLRLYHLGSESIWLDEASSIAVAQNNLIDILRNLNTDVHPPLYFIFLHFMMWFGNSEFIIRIPSVLFGILSIPLIYLVAKRLFSAKEAIISAAFLSFSYYHIYHSQDARMYSALTFFMLASIYFFVPAIEDKNKKYWIGFIFSAICSIYTHVFGFFILAIAILYYVFTQISYNSAINKIKFKEIDTAKYFGVSLGVIFVFAIPLILSIFNRIPSRVGGEITWGIKPSSLFITILSDFGTYGSSPSIVFSFFFILGIIAALKYEKEKLCLLSIWFFLPILLSYFLASIMPFQPRYMIFILPAFLIFITKGITATAEYFFPVNKTIQSEVSGTIKYHYIAIIMIILLFCIISYSPLEKYYTTNQKPDWKGAVSFLENNTNSGDIVVPLPGNIKKVLVYYYDNSSDETRIVSIPYSIDKIKEITSKNRTHTIWFVMTADTRSIDPEGNVLKWLQSNTNLEQRNPRLYILSA